MNTNPASHRESGEKPTVSAHTTPSATEVDLQAVRNIISKSSRFSRRQETFKDYDTARESRRQQVAAKLGLPDDTSWEEIKKLQAQLSKEKNQAKAVEHQKAVKDLGLSPTTATRKQISEAGDNLQRQARAGSLGLSPDATWKEINLAIRAESTRRYKEQKSEADEKYRKKETSRLGLPVDTTLQEITDYENELEKRRKITARDLGLDENASWSAIEGKQAKRARQEEAKKPKK